MEDTSRVRSLRTTVRSTLAVLLTALTVLLLFYLLYRMQTLVRWSILALFLAVALHPPVNWLHHSGVPRVVAILLIYLALFIAVVALGTLIVPPLAIQIEQLGGYIAHVLERPGGLDAEVQRLVGRSGLSDYTGMLRTQLHALPGQLGTAMGSVITLTTGIVTSLVALVSIAVLTFFLLNDGAALVAAGLRLCPDEHRPLAQRILTQSAGAISGYIAGNLAISAIAGACAYVGMAVLGIPYALALALLLGLLDLIPMVGATLGAIPVVAVAFIVSPVKALILVIYIIVYQQVESNVLQPLIYGRSVQLPALAVFVAVLVGGELMGIIGALIAIPIADIIRIVGTEWLAYRARRSTMTAGVSVQTVALHGALTTERPVERAAGRAQS